jgi:2-polyprenyl-6-methoxyphenol hydroxylase-like FAD-dependent oxidoreductase
MTTTADVLIVGAGPVGTALAIDLIRRGLTVAVIDKSRSWLRGIARAKGIQPRTLEVLEDLGALDVLADGSLYPLMGFHKRTG